VATCAVGSPLRQRGFVTCRAIISERDAACHVRCTEHCRHASARHSSRVCATSTEREEAVIRERFSVYVGLRARKIETMRSLTAIVDDLNPGSLDEGVRRARQPPAPSVRVGASSTAVLAVRLARHIRLHQLRLVWAAAASRSRRNGLCPEAKSERTRRLSGGGRIHRDYEPQGSRRGAGQDPSPSVRRRNAG
jgi:hypothetical protein